MAYIYVCMYIWRLIHDSVDGKNLDKGHYHEKKKERKRTFFCDDSTPDEHGMASATSQIWPLNQLGLTPKVKLTPQ